jgi:hypothetical protein
MEENNLSEFKIVAISCTKDSRADKNKYRIMAILKVEKELLSLVQLIATILNSDKLFSSIVIIGKLKSDLLNQILGLFVL